MVHLRSPGSLPVAALPRLLFAGRFASAQDVPFHRHEGIELVLVTSGSCRITVAGTGLEGAAGEVFVLPARVDHDQVARASMVRTTYVVLQAPRLTIASTPRLVRLEPGDRAATWFEDLHRLFHGPDPAGDGVTGGLLLAVLERLNDLERRQGLTQSLPAPLARAVRYIERHRLEPLDARRIARDAGVSASHLGALFRARFACGPLKYQQRLRLQLAAKLLADSYLAVAEVGAACGYEDANYFARIFRTHHGLPPARWRRRALPNRRS